MTTVRYLIAYMACPAGTEVMVDDRTASELIAEGIAEPVVKVVSTPPANKSCACRCGCCRTK